MYRVNYLFICLFIYFIFFFAILKCYTFIVIIKYKEKQVLND